MDPKTQRQFNCPTSAMSYMYKRRRERTYPSHEQPERNPELAEVVDPKTRIRGAPQAARAVELGEAVEKNDADDGHEREDAQDGRIRKHGERHEHSRYKSGASVVSSPGLLDASGVYLHDESEYLVSIRGISWKDSV